MGLVTGDRLGPYEIIAPIGAGGMGEVYRAKDTRLKREVAVKVLPPAFSEDPDRLRRFTLEAQAVAALSHPNILAVYDVGEHEGSPYIVMELLEGESLRRALRGESLPARKAVEYAVQIAQGLGAAHQKGIVHRDLKPENVFVSKDGRVKILDFGLARVAEATAAEANLSKETTADPGTGPGVIMGTASYMSPEQARGLPADARSDIFSFGVVLYEMLSGKRAFGGDTGSDVMAAILKEEPAPLPPGTPPVLDKIVRQCIQKRPEERFSSAHDLALALQAISGSEAVSYASQAGAGHPRRRAAIFGAIAAALLLALIVSLLLFYLGRGTKRPAIPFEHVKVSRLTRDGMAGGRAAISPDGRYVGYAVLEEQGRESLWVQQVATSSTVRLLPPAEVAFNGVAFSPDGNYVYYSAYPRNSSGARLHRVPVLGGAPEPLAVDDIETPVTFSPDGKRLAYVRGTLQLISELRIAEADGTGQKVLAVTTPSSQFPWSSGKPDWSPDGGTIAWVRGEGPRYQLQLVDARTGQTRTLGERRWDRAGEVEWLPDGRGLLLVALDFEAASKPQVWLVENPSGAAHPLTNDVDGYRGISLAADGASLVSVRTESRSNVWVAPITDLAKAVQVTRGYNDADGREGLAWTPGGGLIYTSLAGGSPDLWLLDRPGGQARRLTRDPYPEAMPKASPDGRLIVFRATRPGSGSTLWRMSEDGSGQKQITPGPTDNRPIVSADGRWVFYHVDFPIRELRVPIDGGATEPLGRGDPGKLEVFDRFFADSLSPDGRTLAGWIWDQRGVHLAVAPVDGSSPRRDLVGPLADSGRVTWAPDGRSLLFINRHYSEGRDIWRAGLDGAPPQRITDLRGEQVFYLDVSRDGKQIAYARGQDTRDVVLIQQTEGGARE